MDKIKTESNEATAETAVEKKQRLRLVREIAKEQSNIDLDEEHFHKELLQKGRKPSGRDIYLEYAKIILESALANSPASVRLFSQGIDECGKREINRFAIAVSNMADRLTKDHIRLYP